MKGTKELKTNKGITLIALVITIIVMLILVAITISMAVNGGLFEYAGRAVGETQNEINTEQKLANGSIKVGDKWYASIDDYLKNKPIIQSITIEETVKLEIEADYDVITSTPVTRQLTATLNEIQGTITWSSDNETVATVSNTGLVTAISEGTAKITVSVTFEGEIYKDECIVTIKEPAITATTMQSDLDSYLGKTIAYGVEYDDASSYGNNEWEIFYADEEHIYIITKGHLASAPLSITDKDGKAYNGTSDFTAENLQSKYPAVAQGLLNKTYDPAAAGTETDPYLKYSSTKDNMKATQYLLDSTAWEDYAPEINEFADWAIGGPTFELFVKSYNEYYSDKEITLETPTSSGYANPLQDYDSVPTGTFLNNFKTTYWLACPSGVQFNMVLQVEGGNYARVDDLDYGNKYSLRPLVCLKSNVSITWNDETEQYDLGLVAEN